MAGDWIKMRTNLRTHPKVVRIASALKADRLRVIGGLHAVWSLFDAHSGDGRLDGYTTQTLDEDIGWQGFSDAMMSVEWLVDTGDSLCTPGFDEHNGQSAKRRAQESERKRNERKVSAETSASDADKNRTREEKRREEKSKPKPKDQEHSAPPVGDADLFPGVDLQVISDFKALRKQKKAPITKTAMEKISGEAEKAGISLESALRICCSRGWQGFQADWVEPQKPVQQTSFGAEKFDPLAYVNRNRVRQQ